MNKVKKKVVLYFILCLVGCLVVEGIILGIMDALLMSLSSPNDNMVLIIIGVFLILSLMNIVAGWQWSGNADSIGDYSSSTHTSKYPFNCWWWNTYSACNVASI